jgi:poly(3-hydroxybutyrate) depolymerase
MGRTKHTMRIILFQGARDVLVAPVNAARIITQWAQADDYVDDGKDNDSVDDVADKTFESISAGGYAYKKSIYNDRTGQPLIESWMILELKHAWSGGAAGASYTDPKGPDASREIWRFFRESKPLPQTKRKNPVQR